MLEISKTLRRLLVVLAGLVVLCVSVAAQSPGPGTQRITLTEAQAKAVSSSKGSDLAQLAVDAARYHRKAVQADYFPKIESFFANLHFNKFLGETIQLARRTADLPLLSKDQTIFTATVTQPVTPLFKVRQAVEIARADEEIAKAKGAHLAAQLTAEVERTYFAVLIAQRRQAVAETAVMLESGLRLTSTGTPPLGSLTERHTALLKASKELETINGELAELTRALNSMLGFDPDTVLDLAAPEPAAENTSLGEATQQALANSPEIIEAEQTVVKAKAATRLSKLDYVPDVAVIGGYVYETAVPLLPKDFSFIGVMASVNIFDFGKRERTISERKTQLAMAEATVNLVKSKVAANARKAFLDLERTRKIRDLTRQLSSRVPASAPLEAETFQAELDYRSAYRELRRVMEGR
jgi:outer membrane protein TolC